LQKGLNGFDIIIFIFFVIFGRSLMWAKEGMDKV